MRSGGVIVTRDAPDSVGPDGAATLGSVVSDPGANDTIRADVLGDRQRRDAERDGDGDADASTAPVTARLSIELFALLAALLATAAATVAVVTSRVHPRPW